MGFIKNTNYQVNDTILEGKGFSPPNANTRYSFDYAYRYKTYGGSSSQYQYINGVEILYKSKDDISIRQCVILFFLPSIFDGYIEACEVWRRKKQKVKTGDT